ncbi:hypothetical protein WMY93_007377 [Mugilogobius chulae]|uniref:Protein kinase domain-containing protein n=1 Tax=Mugilogobius chulae TaxID=88201 RepID=A0AAW0PFV5_9GOBI
MVKRESYQNPVIKCSHAASSDSSYERFLQDGQVAVGDTIVSTTERYKVEQILGSGSFGLVSLCHKSSTNQKVALKMITDYDDPAEEADMLKLLMEKGGASAHIVEWFGSFDFKSHIVHEFEHLDMSLYDYITEYGPLQLKDVRPIVHQLGSALSFLKALGIVHTDLKPDNIMMVDTVSRPFQVKVIDFGLARHVSAMQHFPRVQPRHTELQRFS